MDYLEDVAALAQRRQAVGALGLEDRLAVMEQFAFPSVLVGRELVRIHPIADHLRGPDCLIRVEIPTGLVLIQPGKTGASGYLVPAAQAARMVVPAPNVGRVRGFLGRLQHVLPGPALLRIANARRREDVRIPDHDAVVRVDRKTRQLALPGGAVGHALKVIGPLLSLAGEALKFFLVVHRHACCIEVGAIRPGVPVQRRRHTARRRSLGLVRALAGHDLDEDIVFVLGVVLDDHVRQALHLRVQACGAKADVRPERDDGPAISHAHQLFGLWGLCFCCRCIRRRGGRSHSLAAGSQQCRTQPGYCAS